MRLVGAGRACVVALVASIAVLIPSANARADHVICVYDDATQQEICYVHAGDDDGTLPSSVKRPNRTPTCYRTDVFPPGLAGRVPCTSKDGVWVQSRQCYAKRMDPQPPPDFPAWGGRTDGAIYQCTFRGPLFYERSYYWSDTPPVIPVDPEVIAEQIVRRMALRKVEIGLAPTPGPGSLGLVGVPVYMWVADPTPQTVGPLTRSASSGGVTVSATARVQKLKWDMGDGGSVNCRGMGTPYQDSFGFTPSPTCGYKYERTSAGKPNNAYTVSVTSYWRVEWTGGGETGWFEFDFTASTNIRVGEAQVLVTKPND